MAIDFDGVRDAAIECINEARLVVENLPAFLLACESHQGDKMAAFTTAVDGRVAAIKASLEVAENKRNRSRVKLIVPRFTNVAIVLG